MPTYFVDGNTANYGKGDTAELPDGTLEGTKGAIPGAETKGDFRKRLATVDDNLKDYAYAAESYDATIVSALAAIAADSDAGDKVAEEIIGVTRDGTKCTEFKQCADLLADGEDINYDGESGPIELGEDRKPDRRRRSVSTSTTERTSIRAGGLQERNDLIDRLSTDSKSPPYVSVSRPRGTVMSDGTA